MEKAICVIIILFFFLEREKLFSWSQSQTDFKVAVESHDDFDYTIFVCLFRSDVCISFFSNRARLTIKTCVSIKRKHNNKHRLRTEHTQKKNEKSEEEYGMQWQMAVRRLYITRQ